MRSLNPWEKLTEILIHRYSLSSDYQVSLVADDLEVVEYKVIECAGAFVDEDTDNQIPGHFIGASVEKMQSKQVIVSKAPDGFYFVRLTAKNRQSVTIMVAKAEL